MATAMIRRTLGRGCAPRAGHRRPPWSTIDTAPRGQTTTARRAPHAAHARSLDANPAVPLAGLQQAGPRGACRVTGGASQPQAARRVRPRAGRICADFGPSWPKPGRTNLAARRVDFDRSRAGTRRNRLHEAQSRPARLARLTTAVRRARHSPCRTRTPRSPRPIGSRSGPDWAALLRVTRAHASLASPRPRARARHSPCRTPNRVQIGPLLC